MKMSCDAKREREGGERGSWIGPLYPRAGAAPHPLDPTPHRRRRARGDS